MTLYRVRASALCIADNRILALKHSVSDHQAFWGVPGGEIEPGESPLDAALRETHEETGYITELLYDPQQVDEYQFVWRDHIFPCRTHWFVVTPVAGAAHRPHPGDVDFITEMRWLPISEWQQLFVGHPQLQRALASIIADLKASQLITL